VQLGLAHRAFEPEQQAIIVVRRIVEPVQVGDQRAKEGTQFQQLVPIPVGPRQAGHLDPQDQAHVIEADLGHQALEAGPAIGRGGGAAEIVVDDQDALRCPSQGLGALNQSVLQARRLLMGQHLLGRRPADGDDGQPLQVPGVELLAAERARG
jgi:hypothetical protein